MMVNPLELVLIKCFRHDEQSRMTCGGRSKRREGKRVAEKCRFVKKPGVGRGEVSRRTEMRNRDRRELAG